MDYMQPAAVEQGLTAVIEQLEKNAAHCGALADQYEEAAEAQRLIAEAAHAERYRLADLADVKRSEGLAALAKAKKLYEAKDA